MSPLSRALSPSAAATYPSTSIWMANKPDQSLVHRHSAIALARTIDEVVALVPPGWVEYLGPELRDVARAATALAAKRRALAGLQSHKAKGTLPAFIPKKRPAIQMSKDVRESAEGQAAAAKLQSEVDKSNSLLLDEAIAIASLEVTVLEDQLTDMRVYTRLRDAAFRCEGTIKEKRKYAVLDGEGDQAQVKFVLSPAWQNEVEQLKADILPLALQARLLAEAKSHVIEVKEKKKREVRAAADTAMDIDKDSGPSGTVGKLVDKAVAKAVKKLKTVHSSKPPATTGKNAQASSSTAGKAKKDRKKKKAQAAAAAKAGGKRRAKKQRGDAMQVDGKGKGKTKGKGRA